MKSQMVLTALIFGAKGLEMLTPPTFDSAKADSSAATGYGCHQCIRYGWLYVTSDSDQPWWSSIESGVAYKGFCCDPNDKTACGTAWTGDHATGSWTTGWTSSEFFLPQEKDLLVVACPWKKDVCINSDDNKISTFTLDNSTLSDNMNS